MSDHDDRLPMHRCLVEIEFLGPDDKIELLGGYMIVREPKAPPRAACISLSRGAFDRDHKGSLYARAGIADYWIVNIPDGRLEVYREPMTDSASAFGWRYGTAISFGTDKSVSPLAAPTASIRVPDLLP